MRRQHMFVLLLGLLVVATACGGSSSSSSPTSKGTTGSASGADNATSASTTGAGNLDLCVMVDAATVEATLGEAAGPGVDGSTGDLYSCSWEGSTEAVNSLSVSVYVHPDAATARSQYEATKAGLDGSDIIGLGDDASYNDTFGLEVLSGRYDISVDNTGPDEKQSDIKIAQTLMADLP